MASGEFTKYNQAVLADDEVKQIQKAKESVNISKQDLQQQKKDLDKELKLATLKDKSISPESVLSAKKRLRKEEQRLSQATSQIQAAESKIQSAKSNVKTTEQLEKAGYKKEVRGNDVIYYKEDTYRKSRNHDRRTYREEEYIFSKDGKPKKFIERDEYEDEKGFRRIDEQEIVEFRNGLVKEVTRYDEVEKDGDVDFEKEYNEIYDDKGRLIRRKRWDDGEPEFKETFDYKNGQVFVEERDYERERRRKKKAQEVENVFEVTDKETGRTFERTLMKDGSFSDKLVERGVYEVKLKTNQETGVKTEEFFGKQGDLIKTITKTPVKSKKQQKQEQALDIAQVDIPQQNRDVRTQLTDITLPISEEQQRNQRQTITPQQLAQRGQPVQGAEIVFGFDRPEEGQINLNPARVVVAPYQLGENIGGYLADTITTRGQNVQTDLKEGRDFVQREGFFGTLGIIAEGTLTAAATDPFGFVGEGVALGGAGKGALSAVKSARRSKVKVKPIKADSQSIGIETAPNRQGLGIEASRTRAQFEIQTPKTTRQKIGDFIREESTGRRTSSNVNREIVDVDARGVINKETRALGQRDPDFIVRQTENPISREFSPADVLEGDIKVNVRGPRTQGQANVRVDGIRQGQNQIINVGDDTFFSRTQNVGKLNNEDIFRTETLNPRTQEVSVALSKNVKQKPTTQPTQDFFPEGSVSQTDVFFNRRDLKASADDIVDADVVKSSAVAQIGSSSQSQPRFINLDDATPIRPQTPKPSKSKPSSQAGGQTQIFDDGLKSQSKVTEMTKSEGAPIGRAENIFETGPKTPTQIPVSPELIKKIVVPDSKFKFTPSLSFAQASSQRTSPAQSFEEAQSLFEEQKRTPEQQSSFDTIIEQTKTPDRPVRFDFSFKSGQAQRTAQENIFDNPVPVPQRPSTPPSPPTPPPKPPRFRFDLAGQGEGKKRKSFAFEALEDDGRYISSLGAALTGKTSKNPTQDISGLRIRAILINGKRK